MKQQLMQLLGTMPEESNDFRKRMRFHQGWWRAFHLGEKEGTYRDPKNQIDKNTCNLLAGESGEKGLNFIDKKTFEIVRKLSAKRDEQSKGIIEQKRLLENLLSSQPMAFNFFARLCINGYELAKKFLPAIVPGITDVTRIEFECAHDKSKDNSAFDIGFWVKAGEQKGFIGLECKYTDDFSPTLYGIEGSKNFIHYHSVYKHHNADHFIDTYSSYVDRKEYNQLFRNEILGRLLIDHDKLDFVYTGLFCHEDDAKTLKAGVEFSKKIAIDKFIILTHFDFIEKMQQLQLSKEEREWTMQLWARYNPLLSEKIFNN